MNGVGLLLPAVIGLAVLMGGNAEAETVSFPGPGITLKAEFFRPDGPGPFPAVVALHGCGGLYGRKGGLSPRHADWAARLAASGFVVMFPDSFGSRGVGSQCKTRNRQARASRERVDDAMAAKAYLQTRPDVKPNAVSLLGWSNGGSTVLNTVRTGSAAGSKTTGPDYARAVALYPGCRLQARSDKWHTAIPLLILIGAADDWTPAAPCEALAERAVAQGEPVSIRLYPGAYHDFDHPSLRVHKNTGLAFTGSGGNSAHSGTDPAARADVLERVPAFLAR